MFKSRVLLLINSLLLLAAAAGCANRPPILNCVADQMIVPQGTSVTVDSNASDPEGKPLTYEWAATSDLNPNAVVFGENRIRAQDTSATYDTQGLPLGRYTLRANVRDSKNTSTCSVNVTVDKNRQAPTIACEPSSLQVTEGQSATVTARATDPNNDTLTYAWTVDGQSVPNNQSSFAFGSTGRPIGVHTVRVTATDVDNMSAGCSFSVTVNQRPNRNPTVTLNLDNRDVFAGYLISATAQAGDPDQDPITYAWSVDGQQRPGSSSQLNINTTGLAGGQHSVSVTVRDNRDGTATATQSFSVRERVTVLVNALRVDNVAKAQLDEIALKMRQNPQLRATLTGHTDDRGSEEANQRVGMSRAEAVRAYLVDEQGVAAGRLEARSAGESQPASENTSEQGRRENRRVEVELF